jgi:hypothetical protein
MSAVRLTPVKARPVGVVLSSREPENVCYASQILPRKLKEREKHFPAIKTVLKVSASYYDAPDPNSITTVFSYIEQVCHVWLCNQ